MRRQILQISIVAALSTPVAAQQVVIQGVVVDESGAAVAYARVVISGQGRVLADDAGRFRASVSPGQAVLDVRRIGFRPLVDTISVSSDTNLTLAMTPVAVPLAGQVVNASRNDALARNGFYDRVRDGQRGMNNGVFVFPEDIEARQPQRISQMFSRAPGVRMVQFGGGASAPATSGNCFMTIYLDGARLETLATQMSNGAAGLTLRPRPASTNPREDLRGISIDYIIAANEVAAIEIYPRAVNAPPQYQAFNGTCGIIAIWTKSGHQ